MAHFFPRFRKIVCTAIFGTTFLLSTGIHAQVYSAANTTDPVFGDSLEGFNPGPIMAIASAKGLDSAEWKPFLLKYERKYIDRRYNLPVPPRNTDLASMRVPNSPAMLPCTNMDFESASFTGWTGFIGDNTVNSNGPLQNITNGIFTTGQDALVTDMNARHTIVSAASGNDMYGGFPCVAPGGNYSCRLGNTYANYQGEAIEQTFTVGPGNTSFTYQYAVVLNDGGHSAGEQPYFRIEMFDQSGNLIPCAQYYVEAAGGNTPGFSPSPIDPLTYYKPWTTVNADLTAYMASTVTIRFTAAGCIYAGHFGYAYVDASCLPYTIQQSDSLCLGSSIILSAPIGATAYQWSPGGQTTDSIVVSTPGTYTVDMTSVTGCHTQLAITVNAYPDPQAAFTPNAPSCSMAYSFTNSSTIASGSMSYQWDFGDGSPISTATSPSYTYTTPGTYTVTLIATSASGCDDTITAIVNPGNGGTAAFSNTTVCVGQSTNFTDQSASAPNWDWDFGDPASGPADSSALQNPSHIYATAGTYTVSLTVGTSPCPSTIQHVITVNALPSPSFVYNQVCSGSLVNFSSTSTVPAPQTITNNDWDFGDPASGANNTSTLLNPSHTFTSTGTYTITLNITTDGGCTQTITQTINVLPPPTSAFTSNIVCSNAPMQFTNTSSNAVNYHWDFGDAAITTDTSNLTNPTYTYTSSGTYTVTLIATPGPCADTSTLVVTVAPGPAVQFASPQVCLGGQSAFTDQSVITSGNITGWSWDFGVAALANDTSNLQNPNYTYTSAGTYNVTLTCTSNNGCVSSVVLPVVINPLPQANFTSNTVCQGTPTSFTDTSVPSTGIITNWSWDFGDGGPLSTSQSPAHTYGNDSTYNVTLIVTNTAGCIDTVVLPATVGSLPVVAFTADTLAGCPVLCVDFTDQTTSSTGNIVQWTWDFGDNSPVSGLQNPSHCFSQTGTYTITLTTMSSAGCSNTLVIPDMITVYPVPHASFSAVPMTTTVLSPNVTFTDLSSGNPVTWNWNFGDLTTLSDTASTQNAYYSYTSEYGAHYDVNLMVTNQYGCVDDTTIEVIVEPDFAFFIPNAFTPNGDGVNDGFYGQGYGITKYEIWIFDRWGNLIFTTTDINEAWDGSVQGKGGDIAQIDVYVWKVALTDVFDKKHKYIGHVSLIK